MLKVLVLLLGAFLFGVYADYKNHQYKIGDEVPVFMNTVGPYKNPTETYGFYEKLPYCKPKELKHRMETLGEVLEGNRMTSSGYDVHFRENMAREVICEVKFNSDQIALFKKAIDEFYYFQLILDELPLWGFIGTTNGDEAKPEYYLYTQFNFVIEYNGDRIVRANATISTHEDSYVVLNSDSVDATFTYSVAWFENKEIDFKDRMKLYASNQFGGHELEIHWFSVLNSVVLVILLTGFLFIILMKVLRADYVRYSSTEDQDQEDVEEYGWKLIHGDVFRFPSHKMMLCSFLGVGAQFLCILSGILILGGVGLYYPYNRGSMKTSLVILYAFTSFVAGYVSSSFYKKISGDKWVWNIILTSSVFPVPLFVVWSFLNSIAWYYRSTQALPFGTILVIFIIWIVVGFPLTIVGGIAGKNHAGEFDAPCRTRSIPREIPPLPWYNQLIFQMIMAGFLPFSAISIELYYIFVTIWGHKLYTLYGILIIVFLILLLVTSFITIALAYFQLSLEDYRWWWRSIFNGGATSFFIYGYAIFFYVNRSAMSGFLQGTFFFGYMFMACYACFLMLGSIAFFSALTFVRYIYKNFKTD